jgi:hypothetical protein
MPSGTPIGRDGTLLALANRPVSEEFDARVSSPEAKSTHDDPNVETDEGLTATSALHGRIDYADLAEHVIQGVTVRMRSPRRRPQRKLRDRH